MASGLCWATALACAARSSASWAPMAPIIRSVGYLLGCHAFTLEETGEYARAEKTGLEGLKYAADDAWGLHAVAHVS